MYNLKSSFKILVLLYLFWIVLTLNFTFINLLVGFIASIIVTIVSNIIMNDTSRTTFKIPSIYTIIRYFLRLLFEIYKSSLGQILRIIKNDCDPVIVEITLDITDPLIITIIANSITLTPGTITVDTDKNKITVLSIKDYGENGEKLASNIKEKFEKLFI